MLSEKPASLIDRSCKVALEKKVTTQLKGDGTDVGTEPKRYLGHFTEGEKQRSRCDR